MLYNIFMNIFKKYLLVIISLNFFSGYCFGMNGQLQLASFEQPITTELLSQFSNYNKEKTQPHLSRKAQKGEKYVFNPHQVIDIKVLKDIIREWTSEITNKNNKKEKTQEENEEMEYHEQNSNDSDEDSKNGDMLKYIQNIKIILKNNVIIEDEGKLVVTKQVHDDHISRPVMHEKREKISEYQEEHEHEKHDLNPNKQWVIYLLCFIDINNSLDQNNLPIQNQMIFKQVINLKQQYHNSRKKTQRTLDEEGHENEDHEGSNPVTKEEVEYIVAHFKDSDFDNIQKKTSK